MKLLPKRCVSRLSGFFFAFGFAAGFAADFTNFTAALDFAKAFPGALPGFFVLRVFLEFDMGCSFRPGITE
jgi:hypothetical protein